MTTITANVLVATYDKKKILPAAADPKRASNQSPRATTSELWRTTLPRTRVNRAKKV